MKAASSREGSGGERENEGVRQEEMRRPPNRSDEHLPPEEEAKREEETREYFESTLPKRHPKPQRSDYSPDEHNIDAAIVNASDHESSIPELDKLRRLGARPEKLVYGGSAPPVDEYVETEYYKDLNCIDKQHHTTGTGFIRVEMEKSVTGGDRLILNLLSLNPSSGHDANASSSCRGNPATNEWIPSTDDSDAEIPTSCKPHRSEPE